MSDNAVDSYDNTRDSHIALRNANMMESRHPYGTQWMAHWAPARSSFTPHNRRHCTIFSEMSTVQRTGKGYLHAKNMNAFDCGVTDLRLDVLQPEGIAFNAKPVQSDTLSAHKLPGSSVDCENFTALHLVNSDNFDSKWKHFPMFDMNRKIGNILAPKKKYRYGTMAVRTAESHLPLGESTLTSNIIQFATEEHQFQTWGMKQSTNQWMRSSKSIKRLVTFEDDYIRSNSCSTVERFKLQQPNMISCLCTKRENGPFSSGLPCLEHSANSRSTHHELCNCASYSTLMVSKPRDYNHCFSRNSGSSSSLPMVIDGSVQLPSSCCPDDIPFPSVAKQHGKEIVDGSCSGLLASNNNMPTIRKFDDLEHVCCGPNKMPKCSIHDLLTQEKAITLNPMESMKGRSQKFLDTTQYLSLSNKMHVDFSDRDKSTESIVPPEVKVTASKMLMLPTTLQCHGDTERSSGLLVNSEDSGKKDGISINKYFVDMQESSGKTDTMYIDGSQSSRSLAGVSFSKSQKEVELFATLTEAEKEASSRDGQAMSRNSRAKLSDMNIKQPIFSEREGCVNNRELSTSRTESMDADHVASHVGKPDNSQSSPLLEFMLGPETVSRWINRLRHDPPDYLTLGTKRLKKGDAATREESQNYNESCSNLSRCLKENQKSDKTMVVPKDRRSTSWDSAKMINCWIGRWCCKNHQSAPQVEVAAPVLREPENLSLAPENFESKQLPSIAAMALMGRVVSNIRPCEFQRRGSSVVWNTEGF